MVILMFWNKHLYTYFSGIISYFEWKQRIAKNVELFLLFKDRKQQ